MNRTLQDRVLPLITEIQRSSRPEYQSADFTELVIAALAIRCGMGAANVSHLVPAMTPAKISLGLSHILMDSHAAVWLFGVVDRCEEYFRKYMGLPAVFPRGASHHG